MFPINPLKIKQRFKELFNSDQRIKKNLRIKTETIERPYEMLSMKIFGKKHKIQYRCTLTAIEEEDGTLTYSMQENKGFGSHSYTSKHPNDPVLIAMENLQKEYYKHLHIPLSRFPGFF